MTSQRIRQLYEARPFRPFTLHLADGRHVPIAHKEFIMTSPSERTLVVFTPDDAMQIVDVVLVTDVELKPRGRKKGA